MRDGIDVRVEKSPSPGRSPKGERRPRGSAVSARTGQEKEASTRLLQEEEETHARAA